MDRQSEERDSINSENTEQSVPAGESASKTTEDNVVSGEENPPFPKNSYKPKKKNRYKKKWLWIALITLVTVGVVAGAYYYFMQRSESETQDQAAQQETVETKEVTAKQEPVTKLRYAYQQGKRTVVREYDVENKKKTDIFEFQAQSEVRSEDEEDFPAPYFIPDVDQAPDGRFAYIDGKGVWKAESDGTAIRRLVNLTAIDDPDGVFGTRYKLDPDPKAEIEAGIFTVSNPQWSIDSEYLGFRLGLYEGTEMKVLDVSERKYVDATDTFRYIDTTKLKDKFEIAVDNQELKKTGLYPEYLMKPDREVNAATLSANKQTLYAILCPPNKPGSGFSTYVPEAGPNHSRDCGEPEDSELIAIDITTGKYQVITAGPYVTGMADYRLIEDESGNILAATTAEDDYKLHIVNPKDGSVSKFDPVSVADIPLESVEAVSLTNPENPVALVYYEDDGKAMVAVVHVAQEQLLNSFWIDPKGAFSVLGVE